MALQFEQGRVGPSRFWMLQHRGLASRLHTTGVSDFMSTVFNE
jgi:hypothetical protein